MKTRSLGKTGLTVSELCMSCWQIGPPVRGLDRCQRRAVLAYAAYVVVVNACERADVYGSCS